MGALNTTTVLPENEGTYITLQGQKTVRPQASVAQTVAIPLVSDWGPLGSEEIAESETFGEWETVYGDSATPGRDAALGAFVGTGVEGMAAAGAVKSYRMAGTAKAKATIILKNTKEGGKNALKLTARYFGTRGNRISVTVAPDPQTEANNRLTVLFDGVVKERYSYVKANLAELAAKLIANSALLPTAEVLEAGTALALVAGTPLANGNSGETLTSTNWLEATEAFEFEDFSIFAPFNLTDEAIVASLFSWTKSQAEEMRPVFTVFGGAASEDLVAAIERTNLIRDPHVVSVGGGAFIDAFLDKEVSTAQLAPRIAGILAGLGESRSLLNVPIAGLKQTGTNLVAPDELHMATAAGVTVLKRTTIPTAELVIANGVTTFNSETDPVHPLELFSDPRIVRVADLFIRRMKEWGDQNIVGPTTVSEETEAAVRDRGQREINALLKQNLILPGKTPAEEPFFRLIDSGGQPAIFFEFGWMFARTTKFLVGMGRVR